MDGWTPRDSEAEAPMLPVSSSQLGKGRLFTSKMISVLITEAPWSPREKNQVSQSGSLLYTFRLSDVIVVWSPWEGEACGKQSINELVLFLFSFLRLWSDIKRGWMMIFLNLVMLSKPERSIRSSCTQNTSSSWFEADPKTSWEERDGKEQRWGHSCNHKQCHSTKSVNFPIINESRLLSMLTNVFNTLNRLHFHVMLYWLRAVVHMQ